MAQQYFRNGASLDQQGLVNRLERCLELFLTVEMANWCRDFDHFNSSLNLSPEQSRQVRGFMKRRQPALYERVNFMHTIRNFAPPQHEYTNPADRHFTPAAQAKLRECYANQMNLTEDQVKEYLTEFPDIKHPSPHRSKATKCEERAEERIFKQVLTWWDCQHRIFGLELEPFNPPYFPDERHLFIDLVRVMPMFGVNIPQLASNLWVYRENQVTNDLNYFRNAFTNPADIFSHARFEIDTNLGDDIKTRQGRLQWITGTLLRETRAAWEHMRAQGRNTPGDEDELVEWIETAVRQLEYINYYLYFQATLQRELIRKLSDKFRLVRSYVDHEHQTQHEELIIKFCKLYQELADSHEVHKQQHNLVRDSINWFMTTVNTKADRDLQLSDVPHFVPGDIPQAPIGAQLSPYNPLLGI